VLVTVAGTAPLRQYFGPRFRNIVPASAPLTAIPIPATQSSRTAPSCQTIPASAAAPVNTE